MGRTQRGVPAGGQDEVRAGVYRGMHRVASAFGDGFSVIEQGSVDVTRDERRHSRFQSWLACQCGPTWLRRDEVTPSYPRFCRRFANSAILSCLDSSTVGAPPPSRRGTQCSPWDVDTPPVRGRESHSSLGAARH